MKAADASERVTVSYAMVEAASTFALGDLAGLCVTATQSQPAFAGSPANSKSWGLWRAACQSPPAAAPEFAPGEAKLIEHAAE